MANPNMTVKAFRQRKRFAAFVATFNDRAQAISFKAATGGRMTTFKMGPKRAPVAMFKVTVFAPEVNNGS